MAESDSRGARDVKRRAGYQNELLLRDQALQLSCYFLQLEGHGTQLVTQLKFER
jgi:hypothetical protein